MFKKVKFVEKSVSSDLTIIVKNEAMINNIVEISSQEDMSELDVVFNIISNFESLTINDELLRERLYDDEIDKDNQRRYVIKGLPENMEVIEKFKIYSALMRCTSENLLHLMTLSLIMEG